MRLIELRLKNLNSLKGEWHIDFGHPAFTNEGIFAITGQTGAGKTTILDAICLALYSQTPRLGDITGSTNEIMTQGTGECSAEVVIEINGKRYQCYWYQHRARKNPKGNLLGIKHEISDLTTGKILEEKKSKTAAYIQSLIGMDFSQFTRSIMLAQGSFAAFLKSDIGDRAAILEKITGTAIYATISLSVHEKKRSEEEVLSRLQAAIHGLSLLSEADEAQLTTKRQTLHEQQRTQRQTLKTLHEQRQWLESIEQLQQDYTRHQADFVAALQAQEAFRSEARRLDIANKALESEATYQELNHSRSALEKLNAERQALSHDIERQQTALTQATTHRHTTNTHVQHAVNALQVAKPILTTVRQLDTEIKQLSCVLAEDHQRKDRLAHNVQRLHQELADHRQSLQKSCDQRHAITTYIDHHQALNDLDTDTATLDSHGGRLKTLLNANINVAEQIRAHRADVRLQQAEVEALSEQQNSQQQKITQQRKQLACIQQQQAELMQQHSPASIHREQEHIDQLNAQITQAALKQQQLTQITDQITEADLLLPTQQKTLSTLMGLITSHQTDIQDAKIKKQQIQEQLSLLQKIAGLEAYIVELKDGVPCPLCGAHKHPYGKHHPLLDHSHPQPESPNKTQQLQQQITELTDIIDALEAALSKHTIDHATKKEALNQQQHEQTRRQQHANTLQQEIQQHIHSLNHDAPIYSDSITAIISPLESIGHDITAAGRHTAPLDSIKRALIAHKHTLRTIIIDHEQLTQQAMTLSTAIEADEKHYQTLGADITTRTTKLTLNTQKIDTLTESCTTHFSELSSLMTTILSLTKKYPVDIYNESLDPKTAHNAADIQEAVCQLNQSIHQQRVLNDTDCHHYLEKLRHLRCVLQQLKQDFDKKKNDQQQLTNLVSRLTAQIDTKQIQLDNDSAALKEQARLLADKVSKAEQLRQDRTAMFLDKDPDHQEHQLRGAVDDAKAKHSLAQRQQDTAQQMLEQFTAQQQQLSTEQQTVRATLSTQQQAFIDLLAQLQFADETAFINARLPKETRDALSTRRRTIDHALHQAESQSKSTQQLLTQKRAVSMTEDSCEVLADKYQQTQLAIDTASQQIGAIDQNLKDNAHQKSQQAAQMAAIDEQKQTLQVWQQLHTLIGSADGKKYRTFAQGLTFDLMVTHANTQLQKMSQRYLLTRDDSNPLELNVIDTYQGGEIRSTKNLSGGEGFIISLALALGLSQMASQNIRVDSLFLDEGFGTLDEESLDIALDTLTHLQQEGKLIGVISHVQALKERILTQIRVEKLSGGFSQMSGQGCHRVVADKY